MSIPRPLNHVAFAAFALAAFGACSDQPLAPEADSEVSAVSQSDALAARGGNEARTPDHSELITSLGEANAELADRGLAIHKVEYVTAADSDMQGQIVFANDRGNKQLDSHWVPNDPRRDNRANITYAIDGTEAATANGVTAPQTIAAVDAAMTTWDDATCSDLDVTNLGVVPIEVGVVQGLLGLGDGLDVGADILHAGWLPAEFFDLLAEDGSTFILGVTFTFTFIDGLGNETDIDGNGKADVALREIYYNDAFPWGIDVTGTGATDPIDIETVVLHEAGHGLSQGHFGRIFGTLANQRLHFAPEAVMNAAVFGLKQDLLGSDTGGHCSIWGSWPNN